jgi:HPt (histidine-containing phosphotransfer) domain-containing protein
VELQALLEALEGDREALVELIGDFLATYPGHLLHISEAICAGNARHLEKSAHKFKGSLGIFSRAEPLALTQRLIDMGERETLEQAPQTLDLLQCEMERLIQSLKTFQSSEL